MFRILIIILMVILTHLAFAGDVYKCTVDGVITFSQIPCGDGEPEKVYSFEKITEPIKNPTVSNTNNNVYIVKAYIINNKIKRSEANIKTYQKKMVKELKKLKKSTYYANTNLAGNTYRAAISNKMVAVSNKYKALIDLENITIMGLKTEIDLLQNN